MNAILWQRFYFFVNISSGVTIKWIGLSLP
jgi:hypothetical protein